MATKRELSDQVLKETLEIRKIYDPECIGQEEYSIIWCLYKAIEGFENLISFSIHHEGDYGDISFNCSLKYVDSAEDGHSFVLDLNTQYSIKHYPFDLDENMCIALSLIDKNKTIRNTHTKIIKTIEEKISTIKFAKFIKDDDLYDENYSFFFDYYGFKIYCKIYFGEERSTTEQILPDDDISMHCQLKVFDDSKELFQNGNDVQFIIADRGIKAHKHILSVQSPVFKNMIENYTPEEKNIPIVIHDVSYETMKEVLRFIYTGKVNDIKNIAKNILLAAKKYEINALKILCEEELIKSLSVENISDMLKFVDQYDSKNLKKSVLIFICNNRKEINDTAEFHETLNTLSFDLLKELVETFMSRE